MSAARGDLGFGRKIGYSFVALMAGNVASTAVLLLFALLSQVDGLGAIGKVFHMGIGQALTFSLAIWPFSMVGWVVVGLPVVLSLRTEIAADLYWITAALIGAILGAFAMALIYVLPDPRHITIAEFRNAEALRLFGLAALIAGVAFADYCAVVQNALRKQAKENGAPKGTPFSLP
jgi:hypothetical protein